MESIVLYLLIIVTVIVINLYIALHFGLIAESKGYNKSNWHIASFFIGLPVWLLIIALPNKTYHEELITAIKQSHIPSKQYDNLPEL